MSLNRGKAVMGVSEKTKDGYPVRKYAYGQKLIQLMESSQKILVVKVDHIGASKLSELRKTYRGQARFLFGKNTLIRRVIRKYVRDTRRFEVSSLLPVLRGNCCLIFLNGNPSIYEMVEFQNEVVMKSRMTCAPRAGDIAPCDVIIRPMDTGLEPTRTAFFAAMNIATKINRGQIQIINRMCVLRAGERVDASQALLLNALGMKPFSYAIKPIAVYDEGECYPAQPVYGEGPTVLTVPESVRSAYGAMVALGLEGLKEYRWDGLDEIAKHLDTVGEDFEVGVGDGGTDGPIDGGGTDTDTDTSDSHMGGFFTSDSEISSSEDESE